MKVRRYAKAVQDLKWNKGVLNGFSIVFLLICLGALWGIFENMQSGLAGELEAWSRWISAAAMISVFFLFLWLARKMRRKAKDCDALLRKVNAGLTESGSFQVDGIISGERGGDRGGTVHIIEVRDLATGRRGEFYVDESDAGKIQKGKNYTIEYIEGYRYALRIAELE